MNKAIKVFRSILTTLLCAMTAMDVVIIVAQVALRYFLKISLAWATELAGVSLVWVTFLGATLATLDESNINFNGFIDKLHGVPKFMLKTVCNLFVIFMCYVLIRYGYKSVIIGVNSSMVALPTTMGVCCSVIPISGVLMACAVVLNIVKDAKACFGSAEELDSVASVYDDVPEEVMKRAAEAFAEKSGINDAAEGGDK